MSREISKRYDEFQFIIADNKKRIVRWTSRISFFIFKLRQIIIFHSFEIMFAWVFLVDTDDSV